MSWKSGSTLLEDVWKVIERIQSTEKRAVALIKVFEEFDCDTTYETRCYQIALRDIDFFIQEVTEKHTIQFDTFGELLTRADELGLHIDVGVRDRLERFFELKNSIAGGPDFIV